MFGAIIGDIVGSIYEFNNIKTKDFPLFKERCSYTDDTVMTLAVAQALLKAREQQRDFKEILVQEMQNFGKRYPGRGYGCGFASWLDSNNPKPYNSYGNGSAMRVSPCGLMAVTLSEALSLAKASAEVTHNHPEGVKGAQAVAGAIFLAKCRKSKEEIKSFIETNFYDLDKTLDEIRPTYYFNETCQETVPQAIQAFLESDNFEDAIRNAISLGGDSDTLAAITGSIAWTFYNEPWMLYKEPEKYNSPNVQLMETAAYYLPDELKQIVQTFSENWLARQGTYGRAGICSAIPHTGEKTAAEQLDPAPICLGNAPLSEVLKSTADQLEARLVEGKEHLSTITWEMNLRVRNYNDYWEQINEIQEERSLHEASLEMCIIYLTYLCRADYHEGGYPDFWYRHRDEVRELRRRILDLLFVE